MGKEAVVVEEVIGQSIPELVLTREGEDCKHVFRLTESFIVTKKMMIGDRYIMMGIENSGVIKHNHRAYEFFTLESRCAICDDEKPWFIMRKCPLCGERIPHDNTVEYDPDYDTPEGGHPINVIRYLSGPNHSAGFFPIAIISTCPNCDVSYCGVVGWEYNK